MEVGHVAVAVRMRYIDYLLEHRCVHVGNLVESRVTLFTLFAPDFVCVRVVAFLCSSVHFYCGASRLVPRPGSLDVIRVSWLRDVTPGLTDQELGIGSGSGSDDSDDSREVARRDASWG